MVIKAKKIGSFEITGRILESNHLVCQIWLHAQ